MLKLLLCLLGGAAIGICLLMLRQQHMELSHQNAALHDQIRARQGRLWNQQLQIAVYTAPNAIERTVSNHQLKLAPQAVVPGGNAGWIDVKDDPDAE